MKAIYFTLILFFVLVSMSFSSIVISERIGDEISPYERDYFFLFPSIQGFEKAVLIQDDTSYVFNIKYKNDFNSKDTTIRITEEMLQDLKIYFENYESLINVDDWAAYNKAISKIFKIAKPKNSFDKLSRIKIIKKDGSEEEYSCFFAIEDFIVVTNINETVYNWRKSGLYSLIHYSEIEYFIEPFNMLIGRNKRYFDLAKVAFDNSKNFNNQLGKTIIPPELTEMINLKKDEYERKELPAPVTTKEILDEIDNTISFELFTNATYSIFESIYTYDMLKNETVIPGYNQKKLTNNYFLNMNIAARIFYKYILSEKSSINFKVQFELPYYKESQLNYSYNAGIEYIYGFGTVPNSFLFVNSEFFAKFAALYCLNSYKYNFHPTLLKNDSYQADLDFNALSFDLALNYQLKIFNNFFFSLEPKITFLFDSSNEIEFNSNYTYYKDYKHRFQMEHKISYIPSISAGFIYRIIF
ncbi:MAG TPA: hypothetical protein PKY56_00200 [Candidatus Kapabacteria bacterium]|nr:hypothetical protein [Candidatus Kapabacteria bacterium]HPO62473.1 hypothetical protein [Candidatus Kapabacteria bacterium]